MTQEEKSIAERLDALEREAVTHDAVQAVTKDVVKEALKEWLDEKFLMVGKWTVNGFLAAALAALVYAILVHQGWRQSP